VLCGASRRPLAPGWWLVSVPPGVIVARPGAIAASSCCLLTIAGKEKGGPHAAEERVEWNRKKNRGKRYYIGAPPIKLYNNNTSCPVELLYLRYLAAIYTGAAAVAPVPFFLLVSCVSAEGSDDFPSVPTIFYSCSCVLSAPLFFSIFNRKIRKNKNKDIVNRLSDITQLFTFNWREREIQLRKNVVLFLVLCHFVLGFGFRQWRRHGRETGVLMAGNGEQQVRTIEKWEWIIHCVGAGSLGTQSQ
jgi:hypothetical protein